MKTAISGPMRGLPLFALIPLALLTSACWKPGPGQVDPTRYPWDVREQPVRGTGEHGHEAQPRPVAEPQPVPEPQPEPEPEFNACVVPLEPVAASGIIISGNAKPQPGCEQFENREITPAGEAETNPGEIVPSSGWNTDPPP